VLPKEFTRVIALQALLQLMASASCFNDQRMVSADIKYAVPSAEGMYYRYCFVSEDGVREKNLKSEEWLDDDIVPGSVRCDRQKIVPTSIADARHTSRATLGVQGFQLLSHTEKFVLPDILAPEDFNAWVYEELLPKAAPLVQAAIEESYGPVVAVHAIDVTLRATDGVGSNARSTVKEAHADFTQRSGARRLQTETAKFKFGDQNPICVEDKVLFVNLWQPIVDTVYRVPLAVCDVRSLSESDLVTKTMHFKERDAEVSNIKHNADQKWWYFKHMSKDEALAFVSWNPHGFSTPHSAFEDPTDAQDSPPRRSMEVRFAIKMAA
jgi:hypothetical protein